MTEPTRRQFLGAAAVCAALPMGEVQNYSQEGEFETPNENPFASLSVDTSDFDASYRILSYPGDPHAHVGLHIEFSAGVLNFELTGEMAEELAEQLLAAAEEGRQ